MQVIFDGIRRLRNEIDVSLVSAITGFSKDAVRLAFEDGEKREAEVRRQVNEHAAEVMSQRRNSNSKER